MNTDQSIEQIGDPTMAHAFWSADAVGGCPKIPDYAALGLESAVRWFDKVLLWQYEEVENAPIGVIKMDANELLPKSEMASLMENNVTIAHVSDVVRFRAAAKMGGWVIDADNIWLKAPPNGFVFSTLWAKRSGGVAPSSAKWKSMAAAFAKEGWDGGDSINTPFSVVPNTAFANGLLSVVETFVERGMKGPPWAKPPTKGQWNILMWGLRDLILKHGLGRFVRPPIEYGVSPYWFGFTDTILRDGYFDAPAIDRYKFGVQLPHTDEILDRAVAIPTSFILAARHCGKRKRDNVDDARGDVHTFIQTHPTSLISRVLQCSTRQ